MGKAPMRTDKLIRSELRVSDPSDPDQVRKSRLTDDQEDQHMPVGRHPAGCQAESAVAPSKVAIVTGAIV